MDSRYEPLGGADGETVDSEENVKDRRQSRWLCRCILPLLIVGTVTYITIDTATTHYTLHALEDFANFLLERNLFNLTAILFAFGVITPIIGFPFTLFPLLCAFIYEQKISNVAVSMFCGTLLSVTAPVLGSLVCFLISRLFLRDDEDDGDLSNADTKRGNHYLLFMAIDSLFENSSDSIKIQAMMRMSPLVNACVMNYGLGVMKHCTVKDMLVANFIGSVPYAGILCYFGSAFSNVSDLEDGDDVLSLSTTAGMVTFCVGIAFTIAATALITIHTRKKLKEIFEQQNISFDAKDGSFYRKMQSPLNEMNDTDDEDHEEDARREEEIILEV